MTKYVCVSLPIELINAVEQKRKNYPYTSRADFIKEACRHEIQRLERMERKQPCQ